MEIWEEKKSHGGGKRKLLLLCCFFLLDFFFSNSLAARNFTFTGFFYLYMHMGICQFGTFCSLYLIFSPPPQNFYFSLEQYFQNAISEFSLNTNFGTAFPKLCRI
jgi:hypothetical protein